MSIIELIGVGAENAIERGRLRQITGMSDRRMRRAITAARLRGVPICNKQDGRGYFIAETVEEKWCLINLLESRIMDLRNQIIAILYGGEVNEATDGDTWKIGGTE